MNTRDTNEFSSVLNMSPSVSVGIIWIQSLWLSFLVHGYKQVSVRASVDRISKVEATQRWRRVPVVTLGRSPVSGAQQRSRALSRVNTPPHLLLLLPRSSLLPLYKSSFGCMVSIAAPYRSKLVYRTNPNMKPITGFRLTLTDMTGWNCWAFHSSILYHIHGSINLLLFFYIKVCLQFPLFSFAILSLLYYYY